MSATYAPVLWNRQKRIYDRTMLGLVGLYLAVFMVLQGLLHPEITAETLIIRATGTLAFLMLHVILVIGPLARLQPKLAPLLYNRRHLGVTTFVIGAVHGVFNLLQFHSLSNTNPLVSLFASNTRYFSLGGFPFQVFGFFALLILFLMAATSHDFWLKNLSPRIWKTLHLFVYLAYGMLVLHVMLGVIQLEKSPYLIATVGVGVALVIGLHVVAGLKVKRQMFAPAKSAAAEGFYEVCAVEDIAEKRAKIVTVEGQNIAIFKYDGKLSAVSNICRHQHGPLGEGKIIDGCITCPWHGYQYLPHNGQSPPPFKEKLETYDVRLIDNKIWVNPKPHPEGTERTPVAI
jgi:methionine sulfoxide reductase heme-binding subunit